MSFGIALLAVKLPAALLLALLALPASRAAPADAGHGGGQRGSSRACAGAYAGHVVNLCPGHFPNASANRVWLVLFYAPWCGHCQTLEPKYGELARLLQGDRSVGVGALDCSTEEHRGLCRKHKVVGYPTIKAIVNGRSKAYHGAREVGPLEDWLRRASEARGTSGGSARCAAGLFGDRAKDATVPLCAEHFPGAESKNDWLVVFYESAGSGSGSEELRSALNQVAADMGNRAPAAGNAQGGRQTKRQRQRERLQGLGRKYGLSLRLPTIGPVGADPIVKVGGVCCDCDGGGGGGVGFCHAVLGVGAAGQLSSTGGVAVLWAASGDGRPQLLRQAPAVGAKELVEVALDRLGYLNGGERPGGKQEL